MYLNLESFFSGTEATHIMDRPSSYCIMVAIVYLVLFAWPTPFLVCSNKLSEWSWMFCLAGLSDWLSPSS